MRKWTLVVALALVLAATGAHAKLVAETVAYTHDTVKLQGYMVYDDAYPGARPGVLVVHEWWGLNDYARKRADQLASLGYVAFALDMYGENKATLHRAQASEWMKEITQNVDLWRSRASSGLEVLKSNPKVDPSRLAAIGYCFGGATVQQLAYSGSDLRGVVSFHGSLVPPPPGAAGRVKARLLICHGSADPFTSEDAFRTYLTAMEGSGLDWQMILYGGAKHSFTNPEADKAGMDGVKYDVKADYRSWGHMKLFFDEIFAM